MYMCMYIAESLCCVAETNNIIEQLLLLVVFSH